jgi:hypothetical protein
MAGCQIKCLWHKELQRQMAGRPAICQAMTSRRWFLSTFDQTTWMNRVSDSRDGFNLPNERETGIGTRRPSRSRLLRPDPGITEQPRFPLTRMWAVRLRVVEGSECILAFREQSDFSCHGLPRTAKSTCRPFSEGKVRGDTKSSPIGCHAVLVTGKRQLGVWVVRLRAGEISAKRGCRVG